MLHIYTRWAKTHMLLFTLTVNNLLLLMGVLLAHPYMSARYIYTQYKHAWTILRPLLLLLLFFCYYYYPCWFDAYYYRAEWRCMGANSLSQIAVEIQWRMYSAMHGQTAIIIYYFVLFVIIILYFVNTGIWQTWGCSFTLPHFHNVPFPRYSLSPYCP